MNNQANVTSIDRAFVTLAQQTRDRDLGISEQELSEPVFTDQEVEKMIEIPKHVQQVKAGLSNALAGLKKLQKCYPDKFSSLHDSMMQVELGILKAQNKVITSAAFD